MFSDFMQIELGLRTPDGRWAGISKGVVYTPNPVPVQCLSLVVDRVDAKAATVSYRIRPEYDPRIDPTGGLFLNQQSTVLMLCSAALNCSALPQWPRGDACENVRFVS